MKKIIGILLLSMSCFVSYSMSHRSPFEAHSLDRSNKSFQTTLAQIRSAAGYTSSDASSVSFQESVQSNKVIQDLFQVTTPTTTEVAGYTERAFQELRTSPVSQNSVGYSKSCSPDTQIAEGRPCSPMTEEEAAQFELREDQNFAQAMELYQALPAVARYSANCPPISSDNSTALHNVDTEQGESEVRNFNAHTTGYRGYQPFSKQMMGMTDRSPFAEHQEKSIRDSKQTVVCPSSENELIAELGEQLSYESDMKTKAKQELDDKVKQREKKINDLQQIIATDSYQRYLHFKKEKNRLLNYFDALRGDDNDMVFV